MLPAPTSDTNRSQPQHDVLIVGGGIAGIEALMALADLGHNRLSLRLVSDRSTFVLPSEALALPWRSPLVHVDLERMCRAFGARFVLGRVTGVDAGAHEVYLADGGTLGYQQLLLAPGATSEFAYPGTRSVGFGDLPHELAESGSGSVAVIVPSGASWTLPAYQLALSAAGRGRSVRVLTAEPHALERFGGGARPAILALLARHGVDVEPHAAPAVGERVAGAADLVVALPLLRGPAIAGLPRGDRGFVHVDTHGRVGGLDDVRAVGDAADYGIKQGGIAAQHAELAAAEIVYACGGTAARLPYAPVLNGRLTAADGEELYLRRALNGLDTGHASATPLWDPPSAICAPRLARWLNFHRTDLRRDGLERVAS